MIIPSGHCRRSRELVSSFDPLIILVHFVQAGFQDDGTYTGRKHPPEIGAECYKMLPVIALKMRKLPAIKARGIGFMWGQPPSAVRGAKLRPA